jgi:hypothetical protein
LSKHTQARVGICTYCGKTKPVTADHIPPKKSLYLSCSCHEISNIKRPPRCHLPVECDNVYFNKLPSDNWPGIAPAFFF